MLGDPGAVACEVLALLPDVGVLSVDHDLVIRAVDGSVFARYGWRADLLVGRPLADAFPAMQVERLRPHYEMALRGTRTATSLAGVDGRGDLEIVGRHFSVFYPAEDVAAGKL